MRDPKDVAEQGRRVERQLAAMEPPGAAGPGDSLAKVRQEARALFQGGRHRHLLAHLRDVFAPKGWEGSTVLPAYNGTPDRALARVQAKVCWDYLEDLARPEVQR